MMLLLLFTVELEEEQLVDAAPSQTTPPFISVESSEASVPARLVDLSNLRALSLVKSSERDSCWESGTDMADELHPCKD